MEIPGIKNKSIQGKIKVGAKQPVANKGGEGGSSSSGNVQGADKTALSPQAVALQKAVNTVKAEPDAVRVDKVDRIKKEIQEGRFKVDSRDLAEKILRDIITEAKFLG
ncbi:MAG: flagellar biosynthesis anti-sigma factor FlgM [Nitrospinaceae bacterium]